MRLHLFEFEDQPWFPSSLRVPMTSYLAAAYRITPFPMLWAERISELLSKDRVNEVVDLGSGSGGPTVMVIRELNALGFETRMTLTDLFPNRRFSSKDSNVRYWPEPVDAANIPPELTGTRTMFAAFHHHRPESARRILRDAFERKRSICIFEATCRAPAFIASAFLIPLLVLVLTPRVRPLSWVQIVYTYLIPILPLLIFWDGLVSQLRTYSVQDLKELTRDLQSADYKWEAGLIESKGIPGGVPFLIGQRS